MVKIQNSIQFASLGVSIELVLCLRPQQSKQFAQRKLELSYKKLSLTRDGHRVNQEFLQKSAAATSLQVNVDH